MSKIKKRLIAFALAIAMAVTLVPWMGGTNVVEANAASLTKDEVNSRINYICSQLEGKVFGVDQNNGCGYKSTNPNHNYETCYNCANYNVIGAGWFQAAFGGVSINQFPEYATPGGGTMSRRADSCAGFASFAEWAIFNGGSGDSVTTYKVGEGAFTYDYMINNARLGDIIRIRDMYHSAIVLEVNPSGCYVLDCNWTDGGSLPNSIVRRHTIGWDGSDVVAISRASCDIIEGKNPQGVIDGAGSDSAGTAWVYGWAFDADDPGRSIDVHVYIGGRAGTAGAECHILHANVESSDVNSAFGISGKHRYSATIKTKKSGNQPIYIYGINVGGGQNVELGGKTVNIIPDNEKPVVSNAKVTAVNDTGYTIELDATDNVGIEKVQFPTWPSYKTSAGCPWFDPTSVSGKHYTFKLPYDKFGKYQGKYSTHVYVYDYAGNREVLNFNNIELTHTPVASANIGKNRFELYDCNCRWTDAKKIAEDLGGHLAVISSGADQNGIFNLMQKGKGNAYWIGATDDGSEGSFHWVTGEPFSYNLFDAGQPDNNSGGENYVGVWRKSGGWNDFTDTYYTSDSNLGFIVEYESCESHVWDKGTVVKAPTCTEAGEMKYTCTECHYSEIREVQALGHDFADWSIVKPATRFIDGLREHTCTVCGEIVQENYSAEGLVTDVTLNKTGVEVEVGTSVKLQANTSPSDAVETGIIWQSSDEDVATVTADGTVTAVGVGEATITASAADSFPPTTEYRYRTIVDYETKTTTTKGSLGEGWEYVSEKMDTTYGAWGSWSGWSRTAPNPGASDTRKVETRTVPVYETQYDYDKWAQYSDGTGWSGPWEGYWSGIYCGNYIRRGWSSSRLSLYKQEDGINFYGRSGDTWYGEYSQQVQVGSYKEYHYSDRPKTITITYTYRRPIWSDWSAWSATPEEAASNKEIETRDVTGSGQATVSASCKVTVKPLKLIGWKDVEGGKAYYVNNERVTGIQKIDGVKYIFNEDGIMQIGWYTLDGKTYYMAADGAVQYGALKIKVGGVMRTFYFDKNGVKQDGFITIKGNTYYFDAVNGMLKGSKKIGKDWYYFNSKGVMQTGWITSNGKTFYFKEDGTRAKGLLEIDNKKYYFGSNGVMTIGWLEKSGKKFYFNTDGSMQFGWKKLNNKYYFFNGKGVMVTGWLQKKGNWYYLQDDGTALMNGTLTVGPKTYVFDSKGICQNP